eukprot:795364-Prorocentrum_minimum.AAC.3
MFAPLCFSGLELSVLLNLDGACKNVADASQGESASVRLCTDASQCSAHPIVQLICNAPCEHGVPDAMVGRPRYRNPVHEYVHGFTCKTSPFLGQLAPGAFSGNGLGGRAIEPSTPAVEGGSAYIPGRIVLRRNGVTSEVCWMYSSRLSLDSYGSRKSSMLHAVPVRQERDRNN